MATATLTYLRITPAGDEWCALFDFGVVSGIPKRWVYGGFTLSDGKTATTLRAMTYVDPADSKCYVIAEGSLSAPLRYREIVTANLSASGVFSRGSDGNAASATATVENGALYKSDGTFGPADGLPAVPYGIPAAVDPTSIGSLYDWAAPDLESFSDGDSVTQMVGRKTSVSNRFVPRSGSSFPQKFVADAFGPGLHGTKLWDDGSAALWRQAWVNGITTTSGDDRTVIGVFKSLNAASRIITLADTALVPTNALQVSRLGSPGLIVFGYRNVGGVARDVFVNYVKWPTTGAAAGGELRFNTSNGNVANAGNTNGRLYDFAAALTDDQMRGVARWLMEFYGAAWAPTLHVRSTGNDTTGDGSAAAPFLTVTKAITQPVPGMGCHVVLQEGDTLSTTAGIVPTLASEGPSLYEPTVIRTEASGSNPYPVASIVNATTSPPSLISLSGSGAVNTMRNLVVSGLVYRCPKKIPTNSPLRIGGDASFDAASAPTINKLLTVVASGSFTQANIRFVNVHGVGSGLHSVQGDAAPGVITVMHDRVSSAHCWSDTHDNPYYASGAHCIGLNDFVVPSAGWEPIDAIDDDNALSHAVYDNYNMPGPRLFRRLMLPGASSHGLQLRMGGLLRESVISQCAIGMSLTRGPCELQDVWVEGGKDINGGPRGMMIPSEPADKIRLLRCILAGTAYTSSNAHGFRIGTKYYNPVGEAPWWDGVLTDSRYELENCTLLRCPRFLVGSSGSATDTDGSDGFQSRPIATINGLTIKKCLLVAEASGQVYDFGLSDAQLSGLAANDVTENLYQYSGTFGETSDGTKTLAQMATILGETDSIEATVTFADDTRRVAGYLGEISTGSLAAAATTDENTVAYAMIADRIAGTATAGYQVTDALDWLRGGLAPASDTATPSSGGIFGAVAYQSGGDDPAPAAPTELLAGGQVGAIALTWVETDESPDLNRTEIERKTTIAGTFAKIAEVAPGTGTYSDSTVTPGVGYTYRVRLFDDAEQASDYSNENAATATAPDTGAARLRGRNYGRSKLRGRF